MRKVLAALAVMLAFGAMVENHDKLPCDKKSIVNDVKKKSKNRKTRGKKKI